MVDNLYCLTAPQPKCGPCTKKKNKKPSKYRAALTNQKKMFGQGVFRVRPPIFTIFL
jgi:hypothetical protein